MAKQFITGFLALCISYGLVSCDRPDCSNKNPIFSAYEMDEEPYRKELIRVLAEEKGNLRYWLKSYQEEGGQESITVYIQNDHVCAQGKFAVTDWTGIEGIKKSKGVGYRGAELEGFDYHVNAENILYFSSLTHIID